MSTTNLPGRYGYLVIGAALVLVCAVVFYVLEKRTAVSGIAGQYEVTKLLSSGDTTGFKRITSPVEITFPDDLGTHPQYRTEWWYYTGNLRSEHDRRFGYELTFFRSALAPDSSVQTDSAWRTNQIYMAHFAVTDVKNGEFYFQEDFSRGAAGLAGAQLFPYRVWLGNWHAAQTDSASTYGIPTIHLKAITETASLDIRVKASKPPVLHGNQGYSRKGPNRGDATSYFSVTRLTTKGNLTINSETFHVSGTSWMDREWGTSALGPDQSGWDWFALQLDNGQEMMYYRIRNQDGTTSQFSEGTLVKASGKSKRIAPDSISMEELDQWTNPRGNAYPSGWKLTVPARDISLTITPVIENQELQTLVRYWEGAVNVHGTAKGQPVSGVGYVELTGYADGSLSAGGIFD